MKAEFSIDSAIRTVHHLFAVIIYVSLGKIKGAKTRDRGVQVALAKSKYNC